MCYNYSFARANDGNKYHLGYEVEEWHRSERQIHVNFLFLHLWFFVLGFEFWITYLAQCQVKLGFIGGGNISSAN